MSALSPDIEHVIAPWPDTATAFLYRVRDIIFEQSALLNTAPVEESLKWGQPSWRPARNGTTLRVYWSPSEVETISLYVHCGTSLADRMRTMYPDTFRISGRRGLHRALTDPFPEEPVAYLAAQALTYHAKRP